MKTIIAATDFSPAATKAAHYAADLACAMQADLHLLHVCHIPVNYSEIPFPSEHILPGIIEDGEYKIRQLKYELYGRLGSTITIYTEVRLGDTITELQEFCTLVKPVAVVMGMQGKGAAERFIFGSNTLLASRSLHWPLIVVPFDAGFTTIKKIGLACDFKNMTESVPVNEIKNLVTDLHASLHVLHIRDAESRERSENTGWLREAFKEIEPDFHFINNENVEDGINEFVKSNNLDLLIVIPKKHSLAEKLFIKSHTRQLVTHTHIPVMTIHE